MPTVTRLSLSVWSEAISDDVWSRAHPPTSVPIGEFAVRLEGHPRPGLGQEDRRWGVFKERKMAVEREV